MKKWICVLLLCGAAVVLGRSMPFARHDVAQLVPVEALVVSLENGTIVLDGGDCRGTGATWEDAWEDLLHGAEGTAFLSTTEYIVLSGGAVNLLPKVAWSEELRPAAAVCTSLGNIPEADKTAKYLSAHPSDVTLNHVRAALLQEERIQLPVLVETGGGLRLYGTIDR